MRNSGMSWGHVLLAVGLVALVPTSPISGALNCEERLCVEVAPNAGKVDDPCLYSQFGGNMYVCRGYSLTYASPKTYGTDSKGGDPATPKDGFYRKVSDFKRDCTDLQPVSCTAKAYMLGTVNEDGFNTQCKASE